MTSKESELELECPLCKDIYREPKTLGCLHSFCLECLETYVEKNHSNVELTCPICRTSFQKEQISNLPIDSYLLHSLNVHNSLSNSIFQQKKKQKLMCLDEVNEASLYCLDCELYFCGMCSKGHKIVKVTKNHQLIPIEKMQNEDQINSISNFNPQLYCQTHQQKEMDMLCEDCNSSICSLCVDKHPSHKIVPLSGTIKENEKQLLIDLINLVRPNEKELKEGINKCEEVIKELEINSTTTQIEINQFFDKIRTKLNEKEQELLNRLNEMERFKKKELELQKEELEFGIESIIGSCQMIEKALCLSTQNDDMRLLSMKKLYESRLNYLLNNIWRIEPCHLSSIQFSIDSRIEQTIYSCILDIGIINSNEISTKKCLILINKKQKIFKAEEFKFGIISYSREGNPMRNGGYKNNFTIKIERELKLDDENEEENNEWKIKDLNNGKYDVKMKIKEEGKYLIFVQFNEIDIHSSPFEIQVCSKQRNYQEILHPKLIFGSIGIKNGQFKNPRSVITNSKGNIIVSDSENHRIQIFDSQGQFISTFGEKGDGNGQFYGPYGIATNSKGNIIVSDENNNRIQIFDSEGNFISKFGIEGDGNGQFNHPNGITIDSNGNILVTEWENHRIQIFDSAGKFISKFGEKGSRNGQLNHPNGIAVNSKGDIIVVDQHNHRIQIFDSNGQFISKFGGQGNAKGRFHYPWGIHVDLEGNILIADRNNNGVQVFSPNGEYIAHIREATPVGITIDPKTQNIIVCGSENKISIF